MIDLDQMIADAEARERQAQEAATYARAYADGLRAVRAAVRAAQERAAQERAAQGQQQTTEE